MREVRAVDPGRSSIEAVSDTLGLGSSRGAQFVSEPRTVVLSVAEIQLGQAHGLVAAVWLGRMVRQRSLAAHFEASCALFAHSIFVIYTEARFVCVEFSVEFLSQDLVVSLRAKSEIVVR